MAGADVQAECVDDAGDEWQLLGGSDGSADADGVVVGALLPSRDVFEGFGEVEFFEGVVEGDFESGAREALHFLRGERGGVGHEFGVESGVIPPVRGDAGNRAGGGGAGTHGPKTSGLGCAGQSQEYGVRRGIVGVGGMLGGAPQARSYARRKARGRRGFCATRVELW